MSTGPIEAPPTTAPADDEVGVPFGAHGIEPIPTSPTPPNVTSLRKARRFFAVASRWAGPGPPPANSDALPLRESTR